MGIMKGKDLVRELVSFVVSLFLVKKEKRDKATLSFPAKEQGKVGSGRKESLFLTLFLSLSSCLGLDVVSGDQVCHWSGSSFEPI